MLKFPRYKQGLDDAIEDALSDLKGYHADEDKHAIIMKQLTELYALRDKDLPKPVSYDTLLTVGGNIIVCVIVIKYERFHLITTQARNFLLKLR